MSADEALCPAAETAPDTGSDEQRRRPARSEMRPRIGPETSWQPAYDVISKPTTNGVAPYFSA